MGENELTVLQKYHIDIRSTRKVRGAVLCEAEQGLFLVKEAAISEQKLPMLHEVGNCLKENGIISDELVQNTDGEWMTRLPDGTGYIVKKWFAARECDIRKGMEVLEASKLLAKIHQVLQNESWVDLQGAKTLTEEFRSHNRELKKVRAFIRNKTMKGEFELLFLKHFDSMFDLAMAVENALGASDYSKMYKESTEQGKLVHGDYNYHNVLLTGKHMAVTNLEHFRVDVQAADFYYFLRKAMEKHRWSEKLGAEMLRAYHAVYPLSKEEKEYLAIRLAYPEKFWKCANTYFHSNKAWISSKSVEKLYLAIVQMEEKKAFLQHIFSFHL